MSSGAAISLAEASAIATPILKALRPHCERIELAGSIRRLQPYVHDIEILAVPKRTLIKAEVTTTEDLFGNVKEKVHGKDEVQNDPGLVEAYDRVCHQNFEGAVGSIRTGKFVKGRARGTEVQVDLFMCNLDNWGNIFVIRTGSADFSKLVAKRWSQLGYKSHEGYLVKHNGTPAPKFFEEEELFEFLRLRTPPPNMRELTQDGLAPWIL